jgi:hypothetical protein
MSIGENGLRGRRIATFWLPPANWEIGAKILGVIWLLFWVVKYGFYDGHFDLFWPSMAVPILMFGGREIRFYEKGISLPKAAAYVFLARDPVLNVGLHGQRFSVVGPDAEWGGPYSGGTFRIRDEDLGRLQAVLDQFADLARASCAH